MLNREASGPGLRSNHLVSKELLEDRCVLLIHNTEKGQTRPRSAFGFENKNHEFFLQKLNFSKYTNTSPVKTVLFCTEVTTGFFEPKG